MVRDWLVAGFYWSVMLLARAVSALVFRVRPTFEAPLPRGAPFLLIANHVSALDPVFVAVPVRRRAHFMATAALFEGPLLGSVLGWLGAFPKQRGLKDREAAATLDGLYRAGRVVTLFPEGVRSWDGRMNPMQPGLGRLVKRLDATVVCARIETGHLFGPRWAKHARRVPVMVSYSAPLTWDADASAEAIEADIEARLRIDVEAIRAPAGSRGRRLAVGLPDYLWACPGGCGALNAMRLDGEERVVCEGCAGGWTVDLSARLVPDGGGEALTVARAYAIASGHFGDPPALRPADRDGVSGDVVLPGAGLRLLQRTDSGPRAVAEGDGQLRRDGLYIGDYALPFSAIRAVVLEAGSRIFLRTAEGTLQLETGDDPPAMWHHFLDRWVASSRYST